MNEQDIQKARIVDLERALKEARDYLQDRENTISMLREENEKRLYEIKELRGKETAYERVLDCIQSFGHINLSAFPFCGVPGAKNERF